MKCLRLGIGMVLMNFVLLAGVVKADVCDEWQRIYTEDERLELLLLEKEIKRKDLEKKVEDLKAKEEAHKDEISKLDSIRQRIDGLKLDLGKLKEKLRPLEDTRTLQAEVEWAEQELYDVQYILANIKALDERVFPRDSQVSIWRRELETIEAEFNRLFPGKTPEDVKKALADAGLAPMFRGTRLDDIHRAIDRNTNPSYGDKQRAIDGTFGAELDGLSPDELNKKEIEERERLRSLADGKEGHPGKIEEAEKKTISTLDNAAQVLMSQRKKKEEEERQAEGVLREAITKRDSAPGEAREIRGQIGEYERELEAKQKELAELEKNLAEVDTLRPSREAAEAEIIRLQAEEASIRNELDRLATRRSELEAQIGDERERLLQDVDRLVNQGREAINRAGSERDSARKSKNRDERARYVAACRDSLVAALVSFNAASNLAMQKQGCLGSLPFIKVEDSIQSAQKIQCGGPAQQADPTAAPDARETKLIKVPNVSQGSTREEATLILTHAGFTNISFTELRAYVDCADKGKVIRLLSPAPGEEKPPETFIQVGTYNDNPCDKKTDKEVSAAQDPGGGWDAAADKAQVSAKTINPDMSKPQTDGPGPSASSQVDQAREVAEKVIPGGPKDASPITSDGLVGALGTAAAIAGAVQGGSPGPGSVSSPSLTRVPASLKPGVTSPMGIPARTGRGTVSGGGGVDRGSSAACEPYLQKLNRLRQTQEQLVRQANAYSRDATSAQARQNACRLAENTEQMIQTINAAKNAGCGSSAKVSPEALSYQLKQWKAQCGGR